MPSQCLLGLDYGTRPLTRWRAANPASNSMTAVAGTDVIAPAPIQAESQPIRLMPYAIVTVVPQSFVFLIGGWLWTQIRKPANSNRPAMPCSTRIREYSFSSPIGGSARSARNDGTLVPQAR